MIESRQGDREAVAAGDGRCRMVTLRRPALGFTVGDVLLVVPGGATEGGELVVDSRGRVGRHGGGPVWGVVVGAIRKRAIDRCRAARSGAAPRLDPRTLMRGCGGGFGRVP